MKKLSLLFTLALATVTVTGCDAFSFINGGTTPEPEGGEVTPSKPDEEKKEDDPEEILIEDILLESYSETLEIGDTYQIDYDVYPHGAYNEVSFDSSNTSVATVSVNGLVEAKAEGNSVITLTSIQDTSVAAELAITVNPAPISNYTVTFNANGGSGTMSQATTTGSTYVTPSCSFTKTNYTFDGWALNSASGTKYNVGDTILNISSDITLYATWRDNTQPVTNYTVTFNANGGSGTMSSKTTTGSTYTTPSCTFTYAGHTFIEWALNSPTGTKYAAGTTITDISNNITLYATWEESGGSDYYSSIKSTDKGEALKTKLHNLIKISSYCWGYGDLYDCYRHSDVMPDGTHFYDIYSDTTMFTLYDSRINASYDSEGDSMNREHMIPQSYFNEKSPMKSDPHHVLPSDGYVNNRRGNYPHGIVTGTPTYTSNSGCKLGKGTGNTTVFEPMEKYKGDTARIYFYFVTCYQNQLSSFGNFSAFTNNTFPSINTTFLEVYLRWSIEDPVSEKETVRNDVIYEGYTGHKGQGNRNPFIDHPEYACRIWGETNSTTKSICGM